MSEYYTQNSPARDKEGFSSFHEQKEQEILLRNYFDESDHKNFPKIHPLLKDLIENAKDKVVLDVGCGLGSMFMLGLLHYGLKPENLYSLDPDPRNFEEDEYPREHKSVAFADNMPYVDSFFDIVYSNNMSIDNPEIDYSKTLEEISRVLKEGGFYLCQEHFDLIAEKYKDPTSVVKKSSHNFLPIVEDNKFLKSIRFAPVERINYFIDKSVDPNKYAFYLFKKL
jgi:ubiquinone/menaquinone biosynthesis C-methylase UbiE